MSYIRKFEQSPFFRILLMYVLPELRCIKLNYTFILTLALKQNQCRQEFGHYYRLCPSQDPREICHALWCSDRLHGAECRTKKGWRRDLAIDEVLYCRKKASICSKSLSDQTIRNILLFLSNPLFS